MKTLTDFDQIIKLLAARGERRRVAVVWPLDATTRHAIAEAMDKGFAKAVFIGCRAEVEGDPRLAAHAGLYEIVDADDPDQAAAIAVAMAREKRADVIMKGMLNTDNLLRALLNKETGILPRGAVLTHITVTSLPQYPKLLMFTDAAVIPYPTPEQRMAQVEGVAALGHRLGIVNPKIALIHCSEKVDGRHFPFTEDYARLRDMSARGDLGMAIVDGPLDVKTALSPAALAKKGLHSPIEGEADALVFPDIEAANAFYKTVTLFCDAATAGLLTGLDVPVVLPSRGDSERSKFCSLALASL